MSPPTTTQITCRLLALARLERLLRRKARQYPRHAQEVTALLARVAYWNAYAQALRWVQPGL